MNEGPVLIGEAECAERLYVAAGSAIVLCSGPSLGRAAVDHQPDTQFTRQLHASSLHRESRHETVQPERPPDRSGKQVRPLASTPTVAELSRALAWASVQVGRDCRLQRGLRRSSRARLRSKPHPYVFGVKRRESAGFHQRDLRRATVGRRQSYGTPRNLPVLLMTSGYATHLRNAGSGGRASCDTSVGGRQLRPGQALRSASRRSARGTAPAHVLSFCMICW